MITVIDYSPSHLEKISPKKCHEGEIPKLVSSRAITLMNGETPLAIIGAFAFCAGVLHIWAIVSSEVKDTPIEFARSCVRVRDYYEKTFRHRRMQIDVRSDDPCLEKFAQFVGFSKEGLMKAYGPSGKDYWLYGRVNPWAQ